MGKEKASRDATTLRRSTHTQNVSTSQFNKCPFLPFSLIYVYTYANCNLGLTQHPSCLSRLSLSSLLDCSTGLRYPFIERVE